MLIDCDSCAVRGQECDDCVVSVLLGAAPSALELDETERRAIDALAEGGLVPRLQLVPVARLSSSEASTRDRRSTRRRAG